MRIAATLLVSLLFSAAPLADVAPLSIPSQQSQLKQLRQRWLPELQRFRQQELWQPVAETTLFVGSSTFRRWATLQSDMAPLPSLNRGFGGSTMRDLLLLADELVIRYQPTNVVIYEGDNDLAYGAALARFQQPAQAFARYLKRRLPGSRLIFVAIKPSPARFHRWPRYQQANHWLRKQAQHGNWYFIDANASLLTTDGKPDPRFYAADGVHLNDAGYRRWGSAVKADLRRLGLVPG